MKRLLLFVLIIMGFCGRFASDAKRCPVAQVVVEPVEPLLVRPVQDDMQCRLWVDSVLDRLSLKERVGQLFIYTIAPHQDKSNRELLRKVIEDYKVGGLLFSGGLMQNQVVLTNEAQRMADIPLLITFDGEWGLSMRLRDTPAFPKNMVLGCIQNDSLLYEYGCEMARQCKELGVQVNFAPVADVNINPKNPVINTRSFGEDPVNVANKVIAYARGLEDGGVLSVAKHFPGHGDTDVDSHKALPVLTFTRERLDSVELYPFKKVIEEGLGGIMVGHLEVPAFEKEPGLPSSLSRKVVYDLLMRELKFRGLVFTDALAMKGVSNNGSLCLKALKAGHDLLLVPRRIKEEVAAVLAAVKRGELSEQAIEEKCRKVLTYKYALGLNKKPMVRLSGLDMRINTPYTRDLIRRLNAAAITVLSNPTEVLPLDPDIKDVAVLNVGTAAEIQPFIKQLSEYTHPVEFRLEKDLSGAGRKALRDKLSKYKRILVCVTEQRLAAYQSFFAEFTPDTPVVYVFFIPGKQLLQIHQGISASKAVVLAHSSDDEVQRQVAKVLYADATADGRLSDKIKVLVTQQPGESFLDKMIALVEGATRKKTPNEIALTILLAGFTLVFVIVCITLIPMADYTNIDHPGTYISIAAILSLFVCLIPTTIGGLLSAIGIAGMDRALRANVITKSGKAVETAGDIDTLLLDKTGTITIGNRKATKFHPAPGIDEKVFVEACLLSSLSDETPEGKSIIELGRENGHRMRDLNTAGAHMIKFTAETKCSGVDLQDGTQIRKGAFDAIRRIVESAGNKFPKEVEEVIAAISGNGGTPLVVCVNNVVLGVIELQDIIKPGIQERFERLRKMGVKTVMVTGDNPLTAKYIAEKAGVDDFIAEAKPEDKMEYIKKEQQAGKLVAMMGDGTNDAPALAQANVGVAMNSGTQAAKEAGNMVDLDNDPTKLIEIVEIGKQLLMTRGTLTTFSIANDVAKYFAIIPALFMVAIPQLAPLNIMGLHSPETAILSAIIFNAVIIPILIPLALRGVQYKPIGASALLRRNLLIYGLGGVIAPFIGIKLIDMFVSLFF